MDRMTHLSLNSLDIALRKQAVSAQNLSNMHVTGYRADVYENFGSLYLEAEDQLNSRAFAITTGKRDLILRRGGCAQPSRQPIWPSTGRVFCYAERWAGTISYQTR